MIVQTTGARLVEIEDTGTVTQTSTASTVVVTDSDLDARAYQTVAYTIKVTTNAIKWSVFGANESDYSDEVAVLAATTVASGASSSYTAAPAPFLYYRVKIIDDSGGVHGDVSVRGVAKGQG